MLIRANLILNTCFVVNWHLPDRFNFAKNKRHKWLSGMTYEPIATSKWRPGTATITEHSLPTSPRRRVKPEDQLSCSSPETICSEQAYGNIFQEWNIWVWWPIQFEKPLVSVSYTNFVWNLALINLVKQKLHIKYGFDRVTYHLPKASAFQFHTHTHKKDFKSFPPYESM